MKKYFNTIFFVVFAIASGHLTAQTWDYPGKDSLSYFLQQRDLISYFQYLRIISEAAYVNEDTRTVLEMGKLIQQDFGQLNPDQRDSVRYNSLYVAKNVWNSTKNLDESLNIYLVGHEHVKNKITLDELAWFIENKISNFYTMKGDYEKADYFSKLVESSLKFYQMTERLSRLYTNRGTQLQSELKEKEAFASFKKGFSIADSIQYADGLVANALSLAGIYIDHKDMDSSLWYLKVANECLPYLKPDKKNASEKKSGLAFEYARWNLLQKKYAESISLFKSSIQTRTEFYKQITGRDFAKIYYALANAYLLSGAFDSAKQTIQLGLTCLIPDLSPTQEFPSPEQLYPENTFMELLVLKSQYYEKLDSISPSNEYLQNALTSINLALFVNDKMRESFLADPSKLIAIQSNKSMIGIGISLLYRMSTRNASHQYFDQARTFFNRSKSILYNEKNQRNRIIEVMTDEDRQEWKKLLDKILSLHQQKSIEQADINSINGEILHCQEQIDSIFSKYNSVSLTTIVPEQYVEYFIGEKEIFTISELNKEKIFTLIGTKEKFQSLIQRLNEYLELKGLSTDEIILQDMFSFLMKPFTAILPEHLVIIPDGNIGFVPFEMLKDDDGKYLLERSTIAYAFEYLTYQPMQNDTIKSAKLFCLAPQYPIKAKPGNEISRGSIYHLPYAKMEVDSIRNLFGDKVVTSQSADKDEWEKNINSSTIFHYAGHAIINGDQSYLAFDSQGDETKQLTGSEISLMHHPLDLVVLSACETGRGKLEQGEGIRSLGKSFMESGTEATIISLWNVNDKSTAFIMKDFYKHLKAGMRKDEALRQAKLNYLKNTTTQNSHPYFWAAFIPAGNMRALPLIH